MTEGDTDAAERRRLGAALRALRLAGPNRTLETAGAAFGTSPQGFRKYETGQAPSIHQPDTQRRLARAVGATREELLLRAASLETIPAGAAGPALSERRPWETGEPGAQLLPFRGRIRPGAWMDVGDLTRVSPRPHSMSRDPRFPNADQYVKEFEGDSMNLAGLADGELVHCVSAADIGYWPLDGHLVEVERLRPSAGGGREHEYSIRQVQVTREGVLLWPRSTNPAWAEPVMLPPGPLAADDADVRILSRVLVSVRRFE